MTWTVGVSTGCCTERPIADALQSAARAGFDVVEVGTPPRHFNPFDPAQVARVRQRLTDLAIQRDRSMRRSVATWISRSRTRTAGTPRSQRCGRWRPS